jgi:hypothetical protein
VFDVPTAEELIQYFKMQWEGDQEVVKRSGRDESIRVAHGSNARNLSV